MDSFSIFDYVSIGINEILEGISDGIFFLNEKGKFVFVNKVIEERSGIPLEQFRKYHYLDILPAEYHENARTYFDRALAGENLAPIEFEYFIANGSLRAVELRARRIVTAGRIPLVFVIARNITEKKEAEKARLAALNEKISILNSIKDGIIVFNMEGIVIDINPAFETMTGLGRDAIIGKHGIEIANRIVHPDYVDEILRNFQHAITGEDIPLLRAVLRNPHQGEIPFFFTTSFIRDEKGLPRSIISILKDISELEKTERALRQSEEQFKFLAENLMIGLFIADRKTGKFLYVNKATCDMFGYTQEEAKDKSIWDVIHPDEHPIIISRVEKRLRGEIPPHASYKYTGIRKDGSHLKVEVSSTPFTFDGMPVVQGLIRDITEIESLQMQLLHAQKMKAIGTLAGGIAHDFNNILMGMQGNISLMLLELTPENKLFEMAKTIQELVKQGASLTHQLLSFARGWTYETKPENLNDIIASNSAMFERTHKEILIQKHLHPHLWYASVNRGQIEQVLLNILVNAWQAMPEGGAITITSSNVELSDTNTPEGISGGKFVRITITDTGTGMDEDTLQRIFDPFFTTKEMGRGVGLGLTSAYGIIKSHHGFIEVSSELGKGTTFSIYLPATEDISIQDTTVTKTNTAGSGNILIIDDEEAVLKVTALMLEKVGYTTHSASTVDKGIALLQNSPKLFDCIILDMILPGTNARETYRRIREIAPDVPIVLASGYSLEGEASELLSLGCRSFLQKPFGIEELSDAIQHALRGE